MICVNITSEIDDNTQAVHIFIVHLLNKVYLEKAYFQEAAILKTFMWYFKAHC